MKGNRYVVFVENSYFFEKQPGHGGKGNASLKQINQHATPTATENFLKTQSAAVRNNTQQCIKLRKLDHNGAVYSVKKSGEQNLWPFSTGGLMCSA